ncbi:MAG TPA: nitric oxide reductase activation protein, partial [Betaproteobacteria bacterium]|nr:nitric oxide reductase activation protein [Betaproteobacteria bacterium]
MADTTQPLTTAQIEASLEVWLEIDLTFLHVDRLAAEISTLRRNDQDFLLSWIRRIATTNIEIAYQFARRAVQIVTHTEQRLIEAWALHAMDSYDREGLRPALQVIQGVERFMQLSHARASGAVFEDIRGVLLNFVRGLSGRPLKLEEGDAVYTDSETLYLPAIVAKTEKQEDNFLLYKAMVAMLWAQTRFGSFRANIIDALGVYPDPQRARRQFHLLETLRLEACLHRELPGLFREMQRLKTTLGEAALPDEWRSWAQQLAQARTTVDDSLRLLATAYSGSTPPPICYQGELRLEAAASCLAARREREKIRLRVKLAQLASTPEKQPEENASAIPTIEVAQQTDSPAELPGLELTLDDTPINPPEDVRQLLTSIYLDWGNIPPEYLTPAGPGEYDPDIFAVQTKDPDAVWQGTYHEEGAVLYPEWDFGRQHYRKNWCVMREKDVVPVFDGFTAQVKQKYSGLIKQLHRAFEAMRDENRRLK